MHGYMHTRFPGCSTWHVAMQSSLYVMSKITNQNKSCMLAMRQAPASHRKSGPLKRERPGSGTASGSGSDGEDAEENEESPLVRSPSSVTANACCMRNVCILVKKQQWTSLHLAD